MRASWAGVVRAPMTAAASPGAASAGPGGELRRGGFTKFCHPKSRTVRKKADQPTNPNHPGVRGVRD